MKKWLCFNRTFWLLWCALTLLAVAFHSGFLWYRLDAIQKVYSTIQLSHLENFKAELGGHLRSDVANLRFLAGFAELTKLFSGSTDARRDIIEEYDVLTRTHPEIHGIALYDVNGKSILQYKSLTHQHDSNYITLNADELPTLQKMPDQEVFVGPLTFREHPGVQLIMPVTHHTLRLGYILMAFSFINSIQTKDGSEFLILNDQDSVIAKEPPAWHTLSFKTLNTLRDFSENQFLTPMGMMSTAVFSPAITPSIRQTQYWTLLSFLPQTQIKQLESDTYKIYIRYLLLSVILCALVAGIWASVLLKEELHKKDKKNLQQQVYQAGKLASLGTMGAGISHELKNPITVILGFAEILRDEAATNTLNPEKVRERAEKMIKQSERMKELVNQIRIFSRSADSDHREQLSLNTIIENTLILFRNQLKNSQIVLDLQLDRFIPPIWLCSNKMESVIQNLIANAKDALDELSEKTDKKIWIVSRHLIQERTIELIVGDNAGGIPKENLSLIFDPFFTTKSSEKGTGLGLSIVHGIIKEHDGSIDVASGQQTGTQFTIRLPVDPRGQNVARSIKDV